MKAKNVFALTALTLAMALTGCGGAAALKTLLAAMAAAVMMMADTMKVSRDPR